MRHEVAASAPLHEYARLARKSKPVTQTVKLEQALFVRLKAFGANIRKSNQDIIRAALIEYLGDSNG